MQHKVDAMANSVCAIVLCLRINLLLVLHVWMYGCISQRAWGIRTVNARLA